MKRSFAKQESHANDQQSVSSKPQTQETLRADEKSRRTPLAIPTVKRHRVDDSKSSRNVPKASRRLAIWALWLALPIVVTWMASPAIGQGEGRTEYPPLAASGEPAPGSIEPIEPLAPLIEGNDLSDFISAGPDEWTSPRGLVSTIKVMVLLTVLSLAPAILMMTTSFVRIVVVLGLLRQALGTQQLPPSQVITSLSLFMTLFVMAPTFTQVKDDAILPYIQSDGQMSWELAWEKGSRPLRTFMSHQIEAANNSADVWLFFRYLPEEEQREVPETYEQVPIKVLLPAFLISELKVAFLIGFQIYLPFLVIDIVVSSVSIAMGMMMLPPSMISLPFKLILFVLVDGWHLVVGMLLDSFYIGSS